ncbi:MAG: Crp/Fnr family transcriptional regulator [Pedobacter sp.]|nr:MAG: Crp/Fnr family transcriptional regulator [Pedobacter sp.]
MPLKDFLQSSGIIDNDVANEIVSHFSPVNYLRNEYFLREGQLSNEYMYVERGFMRAFATDTAGNDVTTNFYTENQVAFEVSSFFSRSRSRENIQCVTDTSGFVLTFEDLNNLFHAMPAFREFGRLILVRGFSQLKVRMLSMITETAEQRYLGLLNNNPGIFQFAPLKQVASYLGITDTSLSRIRKELSHK